MPRADDVPMFQVDHSCVSARAQNPLGVKGCGEAGGHRLAADRRQRGAPCSELGRFRRHLHRLPVLPARVCHEWTAVFEAPTLVRRRGDKTTFAFYIDRPASIADAVAALKAEDARALGGGRALIPSPKRALSSNWSAEAINGLAFIWKRVPVVEFLSRPNGVGFQIHPRFQLFVVAGVLAYSAVFIAAVLVDFLALQPIDMHGRRWRLA